MGLLDKLVSDLIQQSTGFNARKIVRKVGGGKLLLAGGAALAGAIAMDRMKRQGQAPGAGAPSPSLSPAAGPAHLPPIPQVPAAPAPPPAALPPLPPLPAPPQPAAAADEEEEVIPPDLEYAIVRTLIAAALADGHLGEDERRIILERIDESGLPEERVRQLHRDLVLPPTPSELANLAPDVASRETLYSFASLMARSDGTVEATENNWLDRFAATLELSAERSAELAARALSP